MVQRHRGRRGRDGLRDSDRRHAGGRRGDMAGWKVRPTARRRVCVQGAPLRRPNGIAIDPQGNLVVVNMLTPDVLTFSPAGALLKTEQAAQAGNDGIVIMPRRHQVRQQRHQRRRLAPPPRPARRSDRHQHPQRRVDVLRRRRQSAGHPDERQQRAGLHSAQRVALSLGLGGLGPSASAFGPRRQAYWRQASGIEA